jgi:hypothetical protein
MSDREERQQAVAAGVEKTRQQDQAVRLSKFLLFFSFLATMAVIGLLVLVQRNNTNVGRLQDSTADVRESVRHLEDFVNEMEEPDPEDEAMDRAIGDAVAAVPRIESILCEAFPTASACQEVP